MDWLTTHRVGKTGGEGKEKRKQEKKGEEETEEGGEREKKKKERKCRERERFYLLSKIYGVRAVSFCRIVK